MSLNILYIVSSLNFGGAEKQTVADANLIAEMYENANVHLITFAEGPLSSQLNVKVNVKTFQKKGYINTAFDLSKYVRRNNIKIIHSALFAPMVIAALTTLLINVTVIWHFHSHEYDMPLKSKLSFIWLGKLRNVKNILFVNRELMDYFHFLHFPRHKLKVLYNHSEICSSVKNIKNSKKTISIGYLGRVVALKRVVFLVYLAQYLHHKNIHNFIIEIVGDGTELETIRSKVINMNLEKYFIFHGFQSNTIEFYNKFDIFVNPSSEECLSIAMVDAAISKLPIVAFNVGGNAEIIQNNQTGYVVESQEEFNKYVAYLIEHEEVRLKMGDKGASIAIETFGLEQHKKDLANIYYQTLNG